VVLGKADPQRRSNNDRGADFGELQGCTAAHLAAEHVIDTGREVRPVLLGGGDRKQNNRVGASELPKLLCPQSRPFDFFHLRLETRTPGASAPARPFGTIALSRKCVLHACHRLR